MGVSPFVAAALAGLAWAALRRPPSDAETRRPRAATAANLVVLVLVLALAAVAAWPLLDVPFDTDAPVLRAAYAAVDVFGDWNHPFLPYLLNRPTTWLSLEPRALRAVPLLFLGCETALCVVVAASDGGPLAGALSGLWFVCEIPRRHGLVDLGDWDFAGAFLMALALWAQRRDEQGRGAWVALAVLLVGGVFSSWLMIVPAGVLVGCLVVEAARRRLPRRPVAATAALFVALSALAAHVFLVGRRAPEPGHARAIVTEMITESPLGRSPLMIVFVALGMVWCARRSGAFAPRFVFLTLLAVPAAVALAFRFSHVNGGYYVGLVTPLLCATSGAATARAIDALAGIWSQTGLRVAPWIVAGVRSVAALTAALGTVDPPRASAAPLDDDARLVLRTISRDDLPVLTDGAALPRLLAFERARLHEGPISDVLAEPEAGGLPGPRDLGRRIHLAPSDCGRRPSAASAGAFYLVLFRRGSDAPPVCVDPVVSRCVAVQPPDRGDRRVRLYRCEGSVEPD